MHATGEENAQSGAYMLVTGAQTWIMGEYQVCFG